MWTPAAYEISVLQQATGRDAQTEMLKSLAGRIMVATSCEHLSIWNASSPQRRVLKCSPTTLILRAADNHSQLTN